MLRRVVWFRRIQDGLDRLLEVHKGLVEGVLLLFRAISESIRKYMAQRKKVELEKQLDQFYRINKIMIIFLDI